MPKSLGFKKKSVEKIKKLSKLRQGEELEKIVGEEEEVIEATGQESEKKAKKWVLEDYTREEKKQKEETAEALMSLEQKRQRPQIITYTSALCDYLKKELLEEDIPLGFHWRIFMPDKTKVRLDVFDSKLTWRRARGFKISGLPEFDMNACERFALWAGIEIRKEHEKRTKTPAGIILPP